MNTFNLAFSLTVDFSGNHHWLNVADLYQCGEAATAFLTGENNTGASNAPSQMAQEQRHYSKP